MEGKILGKKILEVLDIDNRIPEFGKKNKTEEQGNQFLLSKCYNGN